MRSAYTGQCVRLRRTSDSTESDFGFDANGHLDIAAIESWLGGSEGAVKTLYDQVGTNNFVNTNAATQPRLTNLGVVHTFGTKNRPGFYCRNHSDANTFRSLLSTNTIWANAAKRYSVWGVYYLSSFVDANQSTAVAGHPTDVSLGFNTSSTNQDEFMSNGGSGSAAWLDTPGVFNAWALRAAHRTANGGSNCRFVLNNTYDVTGSGGTGGGSAQTWQIGGDLVTDLVFYFGELIVEDTDISSAQTTIWNNASNYYGI